MIRKLIVSFTLAVLSLAISAPFALGQQQTARLPKQNPFRTPTKDTNTTAGASLKAALEGGRAKAAVNANSSNKNGQLQTFTYTVTSSRDGNSYSGQIVGRNPFTNPLGFTAISTQLVPVIIRTHSVFAGIANGDVVTAPGVTVFNPTVKDDTCLTPPNDVPLTLTQQSPIFKSFDFNFGGTDVGFTQTTDAFQRGNFFQALNFGNVNFDDNPVYHVILSPVNTLAAVVIDIPAGSGIAYPSASVWRLPWRQCSPSLTLLCTSPGHRSDYYRAGVSKVCETPRPFRSSSSITSSSAKHSAPRSTAATY